MQARFGNSYGLRNDSTEPPRQEVLSTGGQQVMPMSWHQTEYRGYTIRAQQVGRVWRVAVSAQSSDMPLMRKHSFDIRASSPEEAVSNIRTRIDLVLDLLR
jgi:hypothetical protein